MSYQTFLESKRQKRRPQGFEPLWLPDFLYDFQTHLTDWAIRLGRSAIYADCGCVAGNTILQGPDGDNRIDELVKRQKSPAVWALDNNGYVCEASASIPFKKGHADLWKFCLSSGRTITVTTDHVFLTPAGWSFASDVSVGSQIVVGRSLSSFSFLPRSTSEFSRLVPSEDDQHCEQTIQGYQYRCSADPCLYGEPLLRAEGTVLTRSPSPIDACGRSFPWLQTDGREDVSRCIRQRLPFDHLSKLDWRYLLGNSNEADEESLGDSSSTIRPPCFGRCVSQFLERGCHSQPECESFQSFRYRRLMDDLCISPCMKIEIDTVTAVYYIRYGAYYDIHVPIFENYLANGIWNHNTGKTPMQLVWAENVVRKTNKPVLIVAPLAVSSQTVDEGVKFGVEVHRTQQGKIRKGVNITNYERLHHFNPADVVGMVGDESSIIKNFDGKMRRRITDFLLRISYRLFCTATPAPNDHMELGTSSEALGVMKRGQMLGMFFVNGGETTQQWILKGHAKKRFWQWMGTWARAIRMPSDLGYEDGEFILPKLIMKQHEVPSVVHRGFLPQPAKTLNEQRAERKRTLKTRCEKVADIVPKDRPFVAWCHLNSEGDLLERLIPDAVQVAGRHSDELKEERLKAFADGQIRVLVTKPKIASFGLNWQHCSDMSFFPSHSHEQFYQSLRRCYRFQQKREVTCNIVTSQAESRVLANMMRKERQAVEMYKGIVREMGKVLGSGNGNGEMQKMELPSWLKCE